MQHAISVNVLRVQGDESPVGPLKLQLPDLSQASNQEGVTIVLEGPDTPADPDHQQGQGKPKEGEQREETQQSYQGEGPYGASLISCAVTREKILRC